MRSVGESPARAILLLICGLLLAVGMGVIGYYVAPSMLNPGVESPDGSSYTGTAEQARLFLTLFAAVFVLGLVAIANGIFMLVNGGRARSSSSSRCPCRDHDGPHLRGHPQREGRRAAAHLQNLLSGARGGQPQQPPARAATLVLEQIDRAVGRLLDLADAGVHVPARRLARAGAVEVDMDQRLS